MSQQYPTNQESQIFSLNLVPKCDFNVSSDSDNVNVETAHSVDRVLLCVPAVAESQRDSAIKPRVARNELPWASLLNPFGILFSLLLWGALLFCVPKSRADDAAF